MPIIDRVLFKYLTFSASSDLRVLFALIPLLVAAFAIVLVRVLDFPWNISSMVAVPLLCAISLRIIWPRAARAYRIRRRALAAAR
jgi:hypothetical protein